MKIVILDGYTLNPGDISWEPLAELGDLVVYNETEEADIISRIGDAQVIYSNKIKITKEVMDACPQIKFIGVTAAGYDAIDIHAAKERGIVVCNAPNYGSLAVSQYAFALLLEICSKVSHHNNAVKEGRWTNNEHWCFWDYPLIQLEGKTIGIIGLGRIGMGVANIAKAMGMNVLAYDSYESQAGKDVATYTDIDTLLKNSDVISLHCPILPETAGIICKDNIDKMKDGVIIINNGRGGLVVEQDLADGLNSGKVYGAGVDVVSKEPIEDTNPLLTAKNCIITPHISWAAQECREKLMRISADNLKAYIEGNPINVVNN